MKHLLAIILVTVFATSCCAEDKAPAKKGKSPWQIMKLKKTLAPVTLTAEQETGFAEVVDAFTAKIKELEGKGLTKDQLKARGQKRKEGRESGVKGRELQTFTNNGFSEEELEMFKEFDKASATADRAVAKMLTEEQLGTLPEKFQQRMTRLKKQGKGKGKGKRKKKKEAPAE